ncbi:hypothetical protein [Chryseobacterium antibioticum]|uniref:hypothetical protein n=1 Tax=Chryseobacterium antibioticum TaxID=2728847 RepID=UPI001625A975|nr:hypothetical protein [Chryseobacterium antibioticum]
MKKNVLPAFALFLSTYAFSQTGNVGINTSTPNPNAVLDLFSATKGLLNPRVALTSTASPAPLSAHVAGMLVYNTATVSDVVPALYYNDGLKWVKAGGATTAAPAMNVTSQTGNYTALATDDIILYSNNTVGTTLTLPTAGISIGKRLYVSVIGSADVQLSPIPRETANNRLVSGQGNILLYTGDAASPWSIISGY